MDKCRRDGTLTGYFGGGLDLETLYGIAGFDEVQITDHVKQSPINSGWTWLRIVKRMSAKCLLPLNIPQYLLIYFLMSNRVANCFLIKQLNRIKNTQGKRQFII